MRPYRLYYTWIDLDHVLAITPSTEYWSVRLDMAFREEPLHVNYREPEELDAMMAEWQKKSSGQAPLKADEPT